jgi:hypothetical protein
MDIAKNLQNIHQQISQLEQQYQRVPGSVKLLVVTKQQSVDNIRATIAAGERCFGENYVQEALSKITTLANFDLEWHFIGKLQANKTKQIAQYFSWVDSIDRIEIAKRLNQQRPAHLPKLNCCIEVNLSQEISKSGVKLGEVYALAKQMQSLERLSLRGLMAIPQPMTDSEQQVTLYRQLIDAQKKLQSFGLNLDIISAGMSHDFAAAIAAGSTTIRIGSAIFGARTPKK